MSILTNENQENIKFYSNKNIEVLKRIFEKEYGSIFSTEFEQFVNENKLAVINTYLTQLAVNPNKVNNKIRLEKRDFYDELSSELFAIVSPIYLEFIESLRG